jgi:uncharacterized protein (TIGR00297 family)
MNAPGSFSEHARQTIHIAMGGFALLLRYLTWWQAALLAGGAILFNAQVLPRIGGLRLYRPADLRRGIPVGILLYPTAVLLLIVVFRDRLDIAAAAWGVLAVGDGMATIAGKSVNGRRVPWNRDKTVAGSVSLCLFGGMAAAFLLWWCRPPDVPLSFWFLLVAPFVAAAAAAAVETIPIRLDDNVSVPATAGAALWAMSLMSVDRFRPAVEHSVAAAPLALAVNLLISWAGYRLRTVSRSGTGCGAIIGTLIFVATGWRGWLLLFLTFIAAAASSRIGLRRKTLLGIAEERGGRRGAGNAIANTGLAAIAGVLAMTTHADDAAMIAFAAALAAGGSDTIASEIGKAWGRHTYLITSFGSVPPGTSGAVSLEGTVAGFAGAVALGLAAVGLRLVPPEALLAIVIGATIGSLAESGLGATLEAPGILNNDVLNFLNTAIAAGVAVVVADVMR